MIIEYTTACLGACYSTYNVFIYLLINDTFYVVEKTSDMLATNVTIRLKA